MGDEFALEPSVPQGEIPARVIEDLRAARRHAVDYAQAFGDALKAQAARHGINAVALRRYITALETDSCEKAAKEAADLERLIGE